MSILICVSILSTFLKYRQGFSIIASNSLNLYQTVRVQGLPARGVCAAACGASKTAEKTRPWNFGACTFCVLTICVNLDLVCPIGMPAALRPPQKRHALDFCLNMYVYLRYFVDLLHFQVAVCNQRACGAPLT